VISGIIRKAVEKVAAAVREFAANQEIADRILALHAR